MSNNNELFINFSDLYICLEVDSYGHFFRKAKTKMICGSKRPCWDQDFVIELEGSQNLRVLLYEDHSEGTFLRAKETIEVTTMQCIVYAVCSFNLQISVQ